MDCRHLEGLYELFLLNVLSEDEEAQVQRHVERNCPACLEGLRQASITLYGLLLSFPPVPSNPKARSRLLRRLKER
ncbi:MAG: hypothetical protein ACRD2B_16115 [Terriglobia bacterium]